LENYTERGFDPEKHWLQSYGTGWQSASFLDQERQLFGAPGGIFHDWDLKTNIDGIYAAGDQLYASDCCGFAAATGYYAGRKAAAYARTVTPAAPDRGDLETEKKRLYAPMNRDRGITWRELNLAISKAMQNYCGGVKCRSLLLEGLDLLDGYEREYVPQIVCRNPHELMRTHEVFDILDVSRLIIHASLARESSSRPLCFRRSDFPEMDPEKDRHFIVLRNEGGRILERTVPHNYYGDVEKGYLAANQDYASETEGRTL
jgi:succinate dehydrogenase/fumarate reductase flavoprotein subunit